MGQYTRRQRIVLARAIHASKRGLVSFVTYVSGLNKEDRDFLKEKFGIEFDTKRKLRNAHQTISPNGLGR